MNIVHVIAGIAAGGAIAWILNKLLANRIEHKGHRIGLKAAAYIVCVTLGLLFAVLGSARVLLNTFITNRIGFLERKLVETFPDSDILEKNIDADELARLIDELKQTVNGIDTGGDSWLESLVYDALTAKLSGYVNTLESGAAVITTAEGENGMVTVKSVLFNIKDAALESVSPYFALGQICVLGLLVIFIAVYTAFALFLRKGGARNKSIMYGDTGKETPPKDT